MQGDRGTERRRRRWRCPCQAVRGFLGTLYGRLAVLLVVLFAGLAAAVSLTAEPPAVGALLVGLAVALAAGLVAAWILTRPLRGLLRSVTALREGDYRHALSSAPGPVSAEVAGVERVCRELLERVARGAAASAQADAHAQTLLARITRELQEPLVAIQAAVLRLAGREGPLSDHARQTVLDAALHGTDRAIRLAGETDGLARLYASATRPRAESFALTPLAQGVVERLRARAARLGVDLEVRAPSDLPLVTADHDLVDEGLFRLVDHAVRHCPAGARVRVTLQGEPGGVRTLVRGLESDLPSEGIAGPLGAGPGTLTAPTDDDALALLIARRVVELHGSELRAMAAPGMHATYAFTLPRTDSARDERATLAPTGRRA